MENTDLPQKQWMTLDQVKEQYGQPGSFKEIFYDWWGGNQWLFFKINHLRGDFYDKLMLWVTELGNRHHFPYIMALLVVYSVVGLLAMRLRKAAGIKQYGIRWGGALIVLTVGFLAMAVMIGETKSALSLPRPFVAYEQGELNSRPEEKVYQLQAAKNAADAYSSFPSGHVGFITLLVVGLWPVFSEGMRMFGLFLIFAVAWSRVSLGMHFPADTLWSFVMVSLLIIAIRAMIYKALRSLFGLHC